MQVYHSPSTKHSTCVSDDAKVQTSANLPLDKLSPAQIFAAKYPKNAVIERLTSPLEIKQWWMYNEWDPKCQFSGHIQRVVHRQIDLHPQQGKLDTKVVESIFEHVRGKFILWQEPKETGSWKKVVTDQLELNWILEHVEILYPQQDRFEVSALNGIVLWSDPAKRKYQLLEGNHRVSAWVANRQPATLPSVLFIGKPNKEQPATLD